jgi:hypothetical protein
MGCVSYIQSHDSISHSVSSLWFGPSRPRRLPLELDVALFGNRRLFDRDHLPLHLSKFGCGLLIPPDKERGRPEDDDGGRGCDAIARAFAVLDTRKGRRPRRDGWASWASCWQLYCWYRTGEM